MIFTFSLGPGNSVQAEYDDVFAARDECDAVARELAMDPHYRGYILLEDDQGQEVHRSDLEQYRNR